MFKRETWMIVGLVLLGAEVAIPGSIVMLFFGIAALIVGAVVAPGTNLPLWAQLALFSVLSVVSLLTLRGPLLRRMQLSGDDLDDIDSLIGATVVVDRDLAPGKSGKAAHRGTSWSVTNAGSEPLRAGQDCRVERVDGLTLYVGGNS